MTQTFGTLPSDVVMDASGNVRSGIRLDVYPDRASAIAETGRITALRNLAGTALPGYVTSSAKGRFEFTIDGDPRTRVAVRDPSGDVWDLGAIETDDLQALLDPNTGKLRADQTPTNVGKPRYWGSVASQAAMIALGSGSDRPVTGDWCIRTDTNARMDLTGASYSNAAHWTATPGGGLDAEGVRDTMATALVEGVGVEITPNDAGDSITIAVLIDDATTSNTKLWSSAQVLAAIQEIGIDSLQVNPSSTTGMPNRTLIARTA